MVWVRIDNRLVHGQVIEAWLPYTGARHLIVANDELAQDILRQQITSLAVPQRVQIHFVPVEQLSRTVAACGEDKIFALLGTCQDAVRALHGDIPGMQLNVGNLHCGPNKHQLLPHVAVTDEELSMLKDMSAKYTVDFRSVPAEKARGLDELLH